MGVYGFERSLVFETFQFIKLLMVNFKRRQIEHDYIYFLKFANVFIVLY